MAASLRHLTWLLHHPLSSRLAPASARGPPPAIAAAMGEVEPGQPYFVAGSQCSSALPSTKRQVSNQVEL